MIGFFRREDPPDALTGMSPGTEDYIMRQVTQFAKAMARIVGLTQKSLHDEAHVEIEQALKGLTGFGPDEICTRSDTELIQMLEIQLSGADLRDRLVFLAALLRAEASLCVAQNRPEDASMRCLRALQFMLWVLERHERSDIPGYAPDVDELAAELRDYVLPDRTYASLIGYFERTSALARAEDTVFDWIDEDPDSTKALEAGIAFYERLQAKTDSELESGDLPRDEVDSGMAELRKRLSKGGG